MFQVNPILATDFYKVGHFYNSNKKVFVLHDQVDWETESIGELRTVFCDGHLLVDEDLATIRARLASNL